MQFLSWTFIRGRIKAIGSMMRDKNVPKRKKALIIFGLIYLVLPVDIIPPVLFPFGILDDLVLWVWIIWHLKDTLDEYWIGEKTVDYSKNFKKKDVIEDVSYSVVNDGKNGEEASGDDKSENTSDNTDEKKGE